MIRQVKLRRPTSRSVVEADGEGRGRERERGISITIEKSENILNLRLMRRGERGETGKVREREMGRKERERTCFESVVTFVD